MMKYHWIVVGMMVCAVAASGCRNRQTRPCSACGATTANYGPPITGAPITGAPVYDNSYVTDPSFGPAGVAPGPSDIPLAPMAAPSLPPSPMTQQ